MQCSRAGGAEQATQPQGWRVWRQLVVCEPGAGRCAGGPTSIRRWFSFLRTTVMRPTSASPGAQSTAGCSEKVCWPQCVAPVGSGAVDSSTYFGIQMHRTV